VPALGHAPPPLRNAKSYSISCGFRGAGHNGNLLTKTDARNITATYTYDALNRLSAQSYSDGTPGVNFAYDDTWFWGASLPNAVGRMVARWRSNGPAELFGYDPVGRVTTNLQCTPVNCGISIFSLPYTYNLAGDITSAATGTGVTISYGYDAVGRSTSVTSSWVDAQHPATLAVVDPSLGYYPTGQLRVMTLGNSLTESTVYEPRLGPCASSVNSSGTVIGTCGDSLPNGHVQGFYEAYGTWGSTYNGNMTVWSAYGAQTFSRYYSYDPLNRLAAMSAPSDPSGCTGLSWSYDIWANRTAQNVTGGTCGQSQLTFNANNRITNPGFQYDAAGNLINDGSHTYTYDAENRLIAVDGGSIATYIYDAAGRRVRKSSGGGTYVFDYLYDLSGKVVARWDNYAGFTGWGYQYVYLNGRLLAHYAGGTTSFVHSDHLGSSRVITGMNQAVTESIDYLPFGEQIAGGWGTTLKFTGKERDGESGLDYFGARYYASLSGRFMSPDPSPDGVALADPQSWNLYAYTRNRPTRFVDVGGKWATPVHADITTFALEGYVSAGELQRLIARQYTMDRLQAPEQSFMHAMRDGRANQSNAEASNLMWSLVARNLADAASSLGPGGSFSDLSLVRLGDAIHTVQDYTSPMHTSAAGELRPWSGMLRFGAVSHWAGESAPNRDWSRIGWAVRLTMAAFMQANPALAAKHGLTQDTFDREANNRVSQYVDWFYTQSAPRWGWEEDAARQCALGNRAAC
jgi:RHS repeat-associated protein